MRSLIYLVFFILTIQAGHGAEAQQLSPRKKVPAVVKIDSSTVVLRHFDKATLDQYSKQSEFQYKETNVDISWWTRFWRAFWDWFTHLFSFGSKSATALSLFWKVIQLLLVAGGLAALVLFIMKAVGMGNIFQRQSKAAPIPYSEFFEDINAIDFDKEIENAVSKRNYRFAVRLLYLRCLKQLSDAGQIDWQIDKTNNAYINELKNDDQRSAFKVLTRQFEYVWYGDFLIDGPVYGNINLSFQDFNKRLS